MSGGLVATRPAAADGAGWVRRLVRPALDEGLASRSAPVRRAAADRLGRRGEGRLAIRALAEALEVEADPEVRVALVRALARRGSLSVTAQLAREVGAADLRVATAAVEALGAVGGTAAIAALVEALDRVEVAPAVERVLVELGPVAVPRLLGALATARSAAAIVRVLGRIGDARAVPRVRALLASEDGALRAAALDAARELRDGRLARDVVRHLSDPDPSVSGAAVRALGAVGSRAEAPALEARLATADDALRSEIWRALARVDPGRLRDRLRAELVDAALPRLAEVWTAIKDARSAELAPLGAQLFDRGVEPRAVADGLALLDGGAGLEALLARSGGAPGERRDAALAGLALALRRAGATLAPAARARAVAPLVALGASSERALTLRALAGDPTLAAVAIEWLAAREPSRRAVGAYALELLAGGGAADALEDQLARERDPEVAARLLGALAAAGAAVSPALLLRLASGGAPVPEALAPLGRACLRLGDPEARRAAAALHAAARHRDARTRVAAAEALGLLGAGARAPASWASLRRLLADDDPVVRGAAALAAGGLAPFGAAASRTREAVLEELAALRRVERSAEVRQALREAEAMLRGARGRAAPPRGDEVVHVRVVPDVGELAAPRRARLDILAPPGRWLRAATIDSGELWLVGWPATTTEVRLAWETDGDAAGLPPSP